MATENVKKKGALDWYFKSNLLARILIGLVAGAIVGIILGFFPEAVKPFVDATVSENKGLTRIELTPKEAVKKARNKDKPKDDDWDTIVYEVTRDGLPEKIEMSGAKGRTVFDLKATKHKDRWALKQVDLAKYDAEGGLEERSVFEISWVPQKGILLPAKILYKVVDKKGEPVKRRNEPNPSSMEFSDYEVELKE